MFPSGRSGEILLHLHVSSRTAVLLESLNNEKIVGSILYCQTVIRPCEGKIVSLGASTERSLFAALVQPVGAATAD